MRVRPRDPRKELRKTRHDLADAEHKLRDMQYSYRHKPSDKLKKQEEIGLLKAKIAHLEGILG